jgi:hypothetical protein
MVSRNFRLCVDIIVVIGNWSAIYTFKIGKITVAAVSRKTDRWRVYMA